MKKLQTALNTIKDEIEFICQNMESFQNHFCRKDTFNVYGIAFDGLNIIFVSVENNGFNFKNERTIEQYLRWKDSL